ncbi:MAG: NAD(P)H-binding protein, partial [Halieaceae bacterium]|nr:NAD(P)H-binding protein [Halieaceae bacterium]
MISQAEPSRVDPGKGGGPAAGDTIALTGATGFIGSALCEQLLRQGFALRALVRSPRRAGHLAARGVQLIEGDLNQSAALQQLV